MSITARQIREASALVGWKSPTVAERALLSFDEVLRAENDEGIKGLGALQLDLIRHAFEAAGVEFIPENRGGTGVRLRKVET